MLMLSVAVLPVDSSYMYKIRQVEDARWLVASVRRYAIGLLEFTALSQLAIDGQLVKWRTIDAFPSLHAIERRRSAMARVTEELQYEVAMPVIIEMLKCNWQI